MVLYNLLDKVETTYFKRRKETFTVDSQYKVQILYLLGQALKYSPALALRLWVRLLAPSLTHKDVSSELKSFILFYVEHILKKEITSLAIFDNEMPFSPHSIDILLDLKSLKREDLLSRYSAIYNRLLELVLFADSKSPRHGFVPLLKRAASAEDKREEALKYLAKGLSVDAECFQVWKQNHVHLVAESNNLLLYVYLHWKDLLSKVSNKEQFTKDFLSLFSTLGAANNKLLTGNYTAEGKAIKLPDLGKQDVQQCQNTIKEFESMLSRPPAKAVPSSTTLVSLLFLLALIAIAVAVYSFNPNLVKEFQKILKQFHWVKVAGLRQLKIHGKYAVVRPY